MARPGIMLYFDMLAPIESLNFIEKGKILEAMLRYARDGVLPQFTGKLAVAWLFLKPRLDKDAQAYEAAVLQRSYANYCRSRKMQGLARVKFEDWLELSGASEVPGTDDLVPEAFRNPNTNTTTNTKTKTNTKSISISKTKTNAEIPKGASGVLGRAELEAIERLLAEDQAEGEVPTSI